MSGYLGNNIFAEIVIDIDIPSSSSSTNTEETILPESADESCLALGSDRRSLPEKTVDNTYSHIKRQHHNTAVNIETTGTTKFVMSSVKVDDVTQPSSSGELIEDEETNNDTREKISPEGTTTTVRKFNNNQFIMRILIEIRIVIIVACCLKSK